MDQLEAAAGSPLAYLVIVFFVAVDAFFPPLPGETLVVAAGVIAGSTGQLALPGVIAAAMAGAFLGDCITYGIGRVAGVRIRRRLLGGRRGTALADWCERQLEIRGVTLIIAARWLPGARTATMLTAGTVGFPLRRFLPAAGVAAVVWALYGAFLGFWGGRAFQGNTTLGLVVAIGITLGVTALSEGIRFAYARWRRGRPERGVRAAPRVAKPADDPMIDVRTERIQVPRIPPPRTSIKEPAAARD